MDIQFEIRRLHPDAELPWFASAGAAAVDLRAMLPAGSRQVTIAPGEAVRFKSGIAVWMRDPVVAAFLAPRSSIGGRGLLMLGSGIIDADYQGEVVFTLFNFSGEAQFVGHRERIAQMMFVGVLRPEWIEVEEFSGRTDRGSRGFGSTGKGLRPEFDFEAWSRKASTHTVAQANAVLDHARRRLDEAGHRGWSAALAVHESGAPYVMADRARRVVTVDALSIAMTAVGTSVRAVDRVVAAIGPEGGDAAVQLNGGR